MPLADEETTGDLLEPDSLETALAGVDAIVHLAAITHARKAELYARTNVEGTRSLVEAARCSGVSRLVHVSSRAIGAGGGGYSDSKRASEGLVAASGAAWTIVRLPEVYGAGSGEGLDRMIALASAGSRIPLVGDGTSLVCPLHVEDAAAAVASCLTRPGTIGVVYTLAGECLTMLEFALECAAAAGTSSKPLHVPERLVRAMCWGSQYVPLPVFPDQLDRLKAARPPTTVRAWDDLGVRPRSLELTSFFDRGEIRRPR